MNRRRRVTTAQRPRRQVEAEGHRLGRLARQTGVVRPGQPASVAETVR